jgi:hypothetical protein
VVGEGDIPSAGAWLIENAGMMSEEMFLDPDVDWSRFDLIPLLALRACTPPGVFTEKAKGGFITGSRDRDDTGQLSQLLFGTDAEFARTLSGVSGDLAPVLITMMKLTYRKKIRPRDPAVERM